MPHLVAMCNFDKCDVLRIISVSLRHCWSFHFLLRDRRKATQKGAFRQKDIVTSVSCH